MEQIIVNLRISAHDYRYYYSGRVKTVVAKDHLGRTIQFPASILQQVVSHDGVNGRFQITIDDNNKFTQIARIA